MAANKPPRQKQHQQQQFEPQQEPLPALAEEPPTSRLCIKNIPKYLPEQRLKDHFSVKGQVTDIKILKTRSAAAAGWPQPQSKPQHGSSGTWLQDFEL
jgi:hypothetical protein